MPQHDRTGPVWTLRRLRRRAAREWDLRRHHRGGVPGRSIEGPDDGLEDRAALDADRPLTTLDATIRAGSGKFYRTLVWADGEPHVLRQIPGVTANPDRLRSRRSLLYFAHHTDVHICDAQSPSRMEVGEQLAFLEPGTDAGHRPQEHATVQVFDQMIRATNRVVTSPLSRADMDFLILTGDNTDNRQYCELRWFIDTLDGMTVVPNSGGPLYEGAQASPDFPWVYHPDDPSNDVYGRFGFPSVPGLLTSAIQPFRTAGSAVPWLTVLGNHDVIWQGTFGNRGPLRLGHIGERLSISATKPNRLWSLLSSVTAQHLGDTRAADVLERWASHRSTIVTADPVGRRQLPLDDYIAEYFTTGTTPGPIGHGFTGENLASGTAYWARPHGDDFLLIGLDTNNHLSGSEGRLGPRQTEWLVERLGRARASGRLVIVFSHHNSMTMTNTVDDPDDPGRPTHGDELVALLGGDTNVILWVNGHDHENRVLVHRGTVGQTGFWEVTTASCIDFGQQSRTIEVMDNSDGTISTMITVIDHDAPLSVALTPTRLREATFSAAEIASLSREFASNDSRWTDPWDQRGAVEDRNVELLMTDPRSVRTAVDPASV